MPNSSVCSRASAKDPGDCVDPIAATRRELHRQLNWPGVCPHRAPVRTAPTNATNERGFHTLSANRAPQGQIPLLGGSPVAGIAAVKRMAAPRPRNPL